MSADLKLVVLLPLDRAMRVGGISLRSAVLRRQCPSTRDGVPRSARGERAGGMAVSRATWCSLSTWHSDTPTPCWEYEGTGL
jgi:hypothetical protein